MGINVPALKRQRDAQRVSPALPPSPVITPRGAITGAAILFLVSSAVAYRAQMVLDAEHQGSPYFVPVEQPTSVPVPASPLPPHDLPLEEILRPWLVSHASPLPTTPDGKIDLDALIDALNRCNVLAYCESYDCDDCPKPPRPIACTTNEGESLFVDFDETTFSFSSDSFRPHVPELPFSDESGWFCEELFALETMRGDALTYLNEDDRFHKTVTDGNATTYDLVPECRYVFESPDGDKIEPSKLSVVVASDGLRVTVRWHGTVDGEDRLGVENETFEHPADVPAFMDAFFSESGLTRTGCP